MKQVNIVGLGEVVLDWVTEVPCFPKPDEKINDNTDRCSVHFEQLLPRALC